MAGLRSEHLELPTACPSPVYAAKGNGDDGTGGRELQPSDERLKETWLLNLNGFNIGLTHYIPVPQNPAHLTVGKWTKKLFPNDTIDVIIYGDTQVEQVDLIDHILCVNPGSPTFPHNLNTQLGTIDFLDLSGTKASATIHQLTKTGMQPFEWENSRRPCTV